MFAILGAHKQNMCDWNCKHHHLRMTLVQIFKNELKTCEEEEVN
jgi:hypothetical protein